jgi:putative Holliday junction resolvase
MNSANVPYNNTIFNPFSLQTTDSLLLSTYYSMKYLGIDYGTKKTGLAISDDEGSFAFPHLIVPSKDAFETIAGIVKENNIETVVIGESVAENGVHNALFEETERFAEKLKKTGVQVAFVKEDFSSVEAHRYQIARGNRDDSAAAIILQRYLDRLH